MCVHICREKRKPPSHRPSPGSRVFANQSMTEFCPNHSRFTGFSCSGWEGWGSLCFFSEAHPARTTLLCQQAVPHQHWQGSTSQLHSCLGPSLHRPHQRHYRDTLSSLPIFPPPARHTQEHTLLSYSSPCRHVEKTTVGSPSLTLDLHLFLCL